MEAVDVPGGLVTHQMELLHVGVNVVEHCKLLRRDLRREHSSADTADPSNSTDPSNSADTSHHAADAATRRGHLLQHGARHLHVDREGGDDTGLLAHRLAHMGQDC